MKELVEHVSARDQKLAEVFQFLMFLSPFLQLKVLCDERPLDS